MFQKIAQFDLPVALVHFPEKQKTFEDFQQDSLVSLLQKYQKCGFEKFISFEDFVVEEYQKYIAIMSSSYIKSEFCAVLNIPLYERENLTEWDNTMLEKVLQGKGFSGGDSVFVISLSEDHQPVSKVPHIVKGHTTPTDHQFIHNNFLLSVLKDTVPMWYEFDPDHLLLGDLDVEELKVTFSIWKPIKKHHIVYGFQYQNFYGSQNFPLMIDNELIFVKTIDEAKSIVSTVNSQVESIIKRGEQSLKVAYFIKEVPIPVSSSWNVHHVSWDNHSAINTLMDIVLELPRENKSFLDFPLDR